jgi:hypothetical protein
MSLTLPDEIRARINGALMAGHPLLLAVVDEAGKPRLSYRGSLQVCGDDQFGFWARNAGGTTLGGLKKNPHVALMYRDPALPAILQFAGRARVTEDAAERARVFESAPEFEQRQDPERKGVAVIIDLDQVEGLFGHDAEGQRRFIHLTRA